MPCQPLGAISICPSNTTAGLVSGSSEPCPAWPWALLSQALSQSWPQPVPARSEHPMTGDGLALSAPSCPAPGWGSGTGLGCQALPCCLLGTPVEALAPSPQVLCMASGLGLCRAAISWLPITEAQLQGDKDALNFRKPRLCYSSHCADAFLCAYTLFTSVMNRAIPFPKAKEKNMSMGRKLFQSSGSKRVDCEENLLYLGFSKPQ